MSRPTFNVGAAHHARLPCDLTSAAEQDHGRDAADRETPGKFWLCIGIDFTEANCWFQLPRSDLEMWRHCATWAAPCRPEINKNRHVRVADLTRKRLAIKRERLALEEWSMTAPARRCF